MLGRFSLRARLLFGVVLLAAVGLAVADAATYVSLRSFQLDQVDAALDAGHVHVEHMAYPPTHGFGGSGESTEPTGDGPPAQGIDWYALTTLGGRVVLGHFLVRSDDPPPKLPSHVSIPAKPSRGSERVAYFTVHAASGDDSYRVRASIDPLRPGRILFVAASLNGVNDTLHRLMLVELLVSGAVLIAIAALGLWVVRLGLRPLREIEATAATIASGDLSRRVERAEPRTEVGRLGLSLNAMLAQIESAFKAREESEGRLRRFIADASHELRTPLAAIRAYAELFGRGAAERPDDLERSMSGISRESERMSVLVDDLLLLARLDEGRPLERAPVDLAEIAGEAVDAARVVDRDRPIEASLEPAVVLGDRDRLRQVVDNLLANVRSHTPPGTEVEVGVHSIDGKAVLRVSDAGPGFTEEEATQVFQRFYRVDSSRARASGGVGLGLSIVAAVAQAHGGDATARPALGGGATFVVTIPALLDTTIA
ncbi:MAG TPA: HAMP domain-containing sensor histidine kinase [Gaiellales bacterium]|nr:HAMP domain-containing sensor histidine kinase [Gaiellales bacterium]